MLIEWTSVEWSTCRLFYSKQEVLNNSPMYTCYLLNHLKKHDTSKNKTLLSSIPRHWLCTINMWIWPRSCSARWLLKTSSSSPMTLLLLVPRRRPDRLTGSSVFQWHSNRSCWWRSGREKVWLSVHAGFKGSSLGKLQRTERYRKIFIDLVDLLDTFC